jgi:hypothetical protein
MVGAAHTGIIEAPKGRRNESVEPRSAAPDAVVVMLRRANLLRWLTRVPDASGTWVAQLAFLEGQCQGMDGALGFGLGQVGNVDESTPPECKTAGVAIVARRDRRTEGGMRILREGGGI